MHPLSSPVREHRFIGRVEMAIGLLFIIAANALSPIDAVIGLFIVTPIIGSVMYFAVFRRVARQSVATPAPAPTADREDPAAFRRRIAGPVAAQVVVYLLLTITAGGTGLLAGIALGTGIALVGTARWLERWEDAHEAGLLREPRSWRRTGGRGGGVRGYYVATGGKTAALLDANRA